MRPLEESQPQRGKRRGTGSGCARDSGASRVGVVNGTSWQTLIHADFACFGMTRSISHIGARAKGGRRQLQKRQQRFAMATIGHEPAWLLRSPAESVGVSAGLRSPAPASGATAVNIWLGAP